MTKAKRNAQTKPVPVTGSVSNSTERKKPFSKRMGREKIKEQLLDRDPTREYQSTRFSYYGELFVQNLPQWRLWTGRMMLTSDPLVNFSLNVRNAALGAAEVAVTSPNPRIQQWVQEQWDYLWNEHRNKLVSAKKWGFAPLQIEWKRGKDGLIRIGGVKDFAPEDCRGLESHGKLVGHRVKGHPIYFPQACWLTFGAEFGSPYGHGTLRRSYPAWYEKWMDHGAKRLMQLRMIKDSYIGDIFWYPPNLLVELPDGTKMSWRDLMREMGENRLSGGAITMPMLYDNNGKELTKYTPPQDTGSASQIFEWNDSCDEGILRGADVPVEVVKASDTGSGYSGRSIPFLVVLSVCTQELVEIIQCVNEQVLLPGAWLNFGGDPEYKITPTSLVESFSNDTSGSAMGGSTLGQPAGGVPGPQQVPTQQAQGQQYSELEGAADPHVSKHFHPGHEEHFLKSLNHHERKTLANYKGDNPYAHGAGIAYNYLRRSGKDLREHTEAHQHIHSAFSKAPRIKHDTVLYRGVSEPGHATEHHKHPISTSVHHHIADDFSTMTGGSGHMMHIHVKAGHPAIPTSHFHGHTSIADEGEVLLHPHTTLKRMPKAPWHGPHESHWEASMPEGHKDATQHDEEQAVDLLNFHGLNIGIECKAGSSRKPGYEPLAHDYGSIRRTEGKDGDQIDVFIGPFKDDSEVVFVYDQPRADGETFDEHKVMIGFINQKDAELALRANYPAGWIIGNCTPMTVDQFKAWLGRGDTAKPVEDQVSAYEEQSHPKAPPGGVTLHGKFYKGGVFIPKEVLAKLSDEDKAKLHPKQHKASDALEHVSHLGGSTGADLMKDGSGNHWVQKKGASEGHAKNEHEANQLYKAMGVPIPASHFKDGKLITEHIEGTPLNQLSGEERELANQKLRKHFVADALLGNWDVIGMAHDNIIVAHNGVPHRVDNGGALHYRAKGALKGDGWNTSLTELDTMRTMGQAGKVFGSVTEEDIKEQGSKILKLAEAGAFDNADAIFKGRLETLKKRINATPTTPATASGKMVDNYDYGTIKSGYESLVAHIGPNLLSKIQARKIAIANVGGDTSKLIIGTTIPAATVDKLKALYPTKQVVIKSSAGYINKTKSKFGLASTKELWSTPLTTFEKGLAAEAAKAGKIPEALNKQIQSLPTAEKPKEQTNKPMKGFEAPHFERPAVTTDGHINYKMEEGNYKAIAPVLKTWENQYKAQHEHKGVAGPVEHFKSSGVAIRKAEAKSQGGYEVGGGPKPDDKQAAAMKEWTDKAPKYHGVVYRGVRHISPGTEAYAAITTVGGIVHFSASAHTSRHPTTPFSFGASKMMMRIATKSGVDVRGIGNYDSEKEVIVPAGTQFKVVGVHHNVKVKNGHGDTHGVSTVFVDLEEVEPHQYAFSE